MGNRGLGRSALSTIAAPQNEKKRYIETENLSYQRPINLSLRDTQIDRIDRLTLSN